jgi:hypothetical protein
MSRLGSNPPTDPAKKPAAGRMAAWLAVGGVIGGLGGLLDGMVLGLFFGDLHGNAAAFLGWSVFFAGAGALLGAALGGIARALVPRLVLRPPAEEGTVPPGGRRQELEKKMRKNVDLPNSGCIS